MNNNEKVTVDNIEVTHEYCGTSQCCGECENDAPVQLELWPDADYIKDETNNDRKNN
jgi:hypothetical protein